MYGVHFIELEWQKMCKDHVGGSRSEAADAVTISQANSSAAVVAQSCPKKRIPVFSNMGC